MSLSRMPPYVEPGWQRLARSAPDWPQVREDIIALWQGRLTKRQLENAIEANRIRDAFTGPTMAGGDMTPWIRVRTP